MLDYRHLVKMTDMIGMLQFSIGNTPNPNSGYTLDDNARALIVALGKPNGYLSALTYATWLQKAEQVDGSWSNLLIDGVYTSHFNSPDSIGRGLLACSLGTSSNWLDISAICSSLFESQIKQAKSFNSPRGIAYTLIALCKHPDYKHNKTYELISRELADKLIDLFHKNKDKNWFWFENYLTYCNGILPQAIFSYYSTSGSKRALKVGQSSLKFLNDLLFRHGYLNIVGNQGWYVKDHNLPLFDQQPVDAASIIFACMEAYQATGEMEYLELSLLAYKWYRGKNIHGLSLYDSDTGGCFDALTAKGLNLNQGAESTLSLILADTVMVDYLQNEYDSIEKTS